MTNQIQLYYKHVTKHNSVFLEIPQKGYFNKHPLSFMLPSVTRAKVKTRKSKQSFAKHQVKSTAWQRRQMKLRFRVARGLAQFT